MSTIHVLHENEAWVVPLRAAFEARGLPYEEWFLGEGRVDLERIPPHGVFYNRMSASAHTRGHRYAPEHTATVLAWLERHGRRVINPTPALRLKLSKAAQYAALGNHGIRVPHTIAATGREAILEAARNFADAGRAFVIKPNRGGKGLGVVRFDAVEAVEAHLDSADFSPSPDGVTLVQQYIRGRDASIIRAEFVGGRFLYAVRVDTSGGFELCPAEACAAPGAENPRPMFEILKGFHHPVLEQYRGFLAVSGIHIAGIEFILDEEGTPFTYDINTNTNYNPEAEARAGLSGMDAIAGYLGRTLARVERERTRLPLRLNGVRRPPLPVRNTGLELPCRDASAEASPWGAIA